MITHWERGREIPLADDADVVVCGGGPAGFAAAVAAARAGARTVLLEAHGCLGGVWTAGALSWILEADKPGILAELTDLLDRRGARAGNADTSFGYDVEIMKLTLDELVAAAGVRVQLHTRVSAASTDTDNRLSTVVTESKSGRQGWNGRVFIDATGDGDLAAQAGCRFDYGHPDTGEAQPMSLMALLSGINLAEVDSFVAGGAELAGSAPMPQSRRYLAAKDRLRDEFARAGIEPSYAAPTLWCIHEDLFALMSNHEYGVAATDAEQITDATVRARAELHRQVSALRSLGGAWSGLRLVSTGAQIGVREGRRVHGRYRVTVDDLRTGTRHHDAVCRVSSGADVHALSAAEGGYLSRATSVLQSSTVATSRVAPVQTYDIPLRALIARDVDGLLLAGRCISGDFLAHASYRVTGNAVAMGQAAGVVGALAARAGVAPHDVPWDDVRAGLDAAGLAAAHTTSTERSRSSAMARAAGPSSAQ
ncbi:FAD-dependent oxidoreductase [Jiangella endophytica]|uniref:FAD-dependent oxidoreductase n=1 Tax=Jiangella endophytica TaxID=1623398 RepID=UPI000E350E4C|nr:FAD-dependent oxidoreductase [Jiangella endophytica]